MARFDAIEVERKYSPGESADLPRLASIRGVDHVGEPGSDQLDAVYFDTEGLALAGQRITLRRRTGGLDAGWHLKLPVTAEERQEVVEPLGNDQESVPERLRQHVLVHTRGRALKPVARIKTLRSSTLLYGADGAILAQFSDDRVEAQSLAAPAEPQRWREWEIELVEGHRKLLKDADARLAAAGVPLATLPSKLARALGSNYPGDPAPAPSPERQGPAADVALSYIFRQIQALKTHDPGVRVDAPDAVHQLRVAARRLRSALATFRKLLDTPSTRFLRSELQWLAGTVGEARDIEVIRARLNDMISAEPPEFLMGPVAQQIEKHLDDIYRPARAAGLAALDSGRYFRLLDSLDSFLADPPLTDAAGKEALKTIGRLVSAEQERMEKAVRAVDSASDTGPQDAALHEVRKCAKRLRYAAEAASPIFGKKATDLARAAEGIQEILGDFHDSVVIRETLLKLAAESAAGGGSGFSYGRLHALEEQRGDQSRARFNDVWETSKPQPLDWK
ncbi:CYTH and CHAD domain-containing protein [Arthrobacter sp. NicSoilB8]|uniref:CYTH and CHAD domain-containing protein n=1 Tax=Arthrobacter sp. NicSoilB8 TaxID=2830998 RepID=UPI001CC4584B|nr:CYTH and CHAD domain-containing protein [Arthrobacter sp. NicSoilB8]BCW71256.1 CHAD domain-containing protein [Arthrobacter sp. NicSoilB8]